MQEKFPLDAAFDAEEFRKKGHDLVNQLADLLHTTQAGKGKITLPQDPEVLRDQWTNQMTERMSTSDFFQRIIDQSIKLHHPRFVGHQVSSPLPISALASLLSATLNNGMGVYEMGEGASALEKVAVSIFCKYLGFESGDGVLTSGGTLANLTALLAARARYQEVNVWEKGTHEQYCIMVSEMAHYCVDRAVRIMGWGEAGIIKIPVNDRFALDTSLLESHYKKAIEEGKKIITIVGSAPCTATGSYDDLETMAAFCADKKIWFHIDGAHGGPAIFSKKYKYLMAGAQRADSVVIDAHKMMMTPALATALLFKNSSDSYNTFSQKAYYLWESQEKKEWHNLARRTFECTKLMMSVKVYSIINEYGIEIFDHFLSRQYDLARSFANFLNTQDDFEVVVRPDSNIVCFRYSPLGFESLDLSELNRKIRKILFEEGDFYLVQTELNDRLYLRVTLMNAFTTMDHLNELISIIRERGALVINSM